MIERSQVFEKWFNRIKEQIAGKEVLILSIGLVLTAIFLNNVPLVIGGTTVYIAYQQWITNKMKLRFEVFERKIAYYYSLKTFMRDVVNNQMPMQDMLTFYTDTAEADFFFGEDIRTFIDDVYEKSVTLSRLRNMQASDPQYNIAVQEANELTIWIIDELKSLKTRFTKYLSLENI